MSIANLRQPPSDGRGLVRALFRVTGLRGWAVAVTVPLLGMFGSGAWAATSHDLLVNHDAFQVGGADLVAATDVVDAPVGGLFVYRAKPKINGASGSVSNAVLTQELPSTALFQGIDAPSGTTCTGLPALGQAVGASVITCTIAELTTTEIRVDFRVVIPDDNTDHKAYASVVAADNTDSNPTNHDRIARNITTYKRADLALAFAAPAANSSHEQGDVVPYKIVVSNTNNTYAFPLKVGERAALRFSQPTGTAFQGSPSSAGNVWACTAGTDTSVTPNVPVYDCIYTATAEVAKNSSLPELTIPVVIEAASGNTAAVASVAGQTGGGSKFFDAYPENNTTNVTIQFTPNTKLDMKLVKTVSPAMVDSQAATPVDVTYTLKATRNSGGMLPELPISITDTLPAGVTFNGGVTGTGWACTAVGQVVTCDFTTVPTTGTLPTLTFKALVDTATVSLIDGKAVLQNSAVLAVANEPVPGANNTSRADLTVSNQIALSTSKAAPNVSVVADGAEFSYLIKVNNDSNIAVTAAQQVTVVDVLDPQLQYLSSEGAWSCTASPVTWTSTTRQTVTCQSSAGIAAKSGSDLTLKVKAHISSGLWATLENQASVSCPSGRYCVGSYPILTNKHTINLSDWPADLSIAKTAQVTPGFTYGDSVSGSEVVYTLTVKNAVPAGGDASQFQTAQTVEVTDVITNLLNSNQNAAAHPVTGAPRYSNKRFVEASVKLPDNTTATVSTTPCEYTPSGNHQVTVKCTLNNVPVGNDDYVITIKARQFVDPTSSADPSRSITNTATVSSPDTAEHNSSNNSAAANVTLTALTNMTAQKQASLANALAGQKIDYTLNATNQGPSQATGVYVEDALPLGLIWVTPPSVAGATCTLANGDVIAAGLEVTAANQTMTCAWSAPFNGGISDVTKSVTYALRSPNVGYPTSINSSAVVRTSTLETIAWNSTTPPTDNTTSKTVDLDAPKLNVLINMGHTQDGLPINDGDNSKTQYTITVTNSGESTSYANNVEMMDVFPATGSTAVFDAVSIDSVQLKSGTNRFGLGNCAFVIAPADPTGLRCTFPWLAPGESVDIKFTMQAMAINNGTIPVGTILHTARVSADVEDLPGKDVAADNIVTDRTSAYDQSQVNPGDLKLIDLSLKKTVTSPAAGDSVQVGGQIAYLLTVKNEETGTKHLTGGNAKVRDVLPVGLALVGTAPSGCTYDTASRTLECTVTSLNAGASVTFPLTVQVNTVAAGQTSVTNQASVSSLGDPVDSNNQAEVVVPVADLDVGLTKAVSLAAVQPGQSLTYTLTVRNLGTAAASGVVVTDTLPAGVSFVASSAGCTAAGSTVTCPLGAMAGSSQQTLSFTAQVDSAVLDGTTLNNCAQVQMAGDKNPSNDQSCASTTVSVPPPQPRGSIGCTVFDDLNQDGNRGPDEAGLAGVVVRLLSANGTLLDSTTTAADGSYGFASLAPGSYKVEVNLPKGYSSTGGALQTVEVLANQQARACFGAINKDPGVLEVVKTVYEDWDAGASCGTPKAVKELLIVEKNPTEHSLTWCFSVTNRGEKFLGQPVWVDSAYPGMVATPKAGTALPLAPGATGIWYFQAKEKRSVVNTVGVKMSVTDQGGSPIPGLPPASSSDDGKATFGMIYDPPYGVKVGTVEGSEIINWTMVWVNDNVIAANNVYVSDTVKAPMEFVPGTLSCVGEGETTVVASSCEYTPATKTISVRANFGADLGKTVANAQNRLFISFHVKVPKPEGATTYENQGHASWTPPGTTDPLDGVTTFVPGVKVSPIDPVDPKVPVVTPPPDVEHDDPSIGRPDPEKPGTPPETPVEIDPAGKGSIGCSVFDDANKNGIRDAGEGGVSGVTIELLDSKGQAVTTTVTALDGSYRFPDLTPGTYKVRELLPQGFDPTSAVEYTLTVVAGQNASACFGVSSDDPSTATIGSRESCGVFNDRNGNGVRDAGETGIAGIRIELLDMASVLVAVTVTDADGAYFFGGLRGGSYKVQAIVPQVGGGSTTLVRTVTLAPGASTSPCFGVQADPVTPPRPVSIPTLSEWGLILLSLLLGGLALRHNASLYRRR